MARAQDVEHSQRARAPGVACGRAASPKPHRRQRLLERSRARPHQLFERKLPRDVVAVRRCSGEKHRRRSKEEETWMRAVGINESDGRTSMKETKVSICQGTTSNSMCVQWSKSETDFIS